MRVKVKKGNTLYSILHLRCPRCHTGELFTVSNTYRLSTMLDMPDHCAACGQEFVLEPGFYSGAMWVSYPIVMVILILTGTIFLFIAKLSFYISIFCTFLALLVPLPLILRSSRAIWINLFVPYENDVIIK